MKKCSHSHHHALAELNITPLLDLAFVLLVIFIITTTPLVNDLAVDLPSAAKRPKETKSKIHYITVQSSGKIYLDKDLVASEDLPGKLVDLRLVDQDINVEIRGSAKAKYRDVIGVMDSCQMANVLKVNLATDAVGEDGKKTE
jgi:biopolymer transport protein ExbD